MSTKRVRLADIAERLNLSKVSVSKALRDHPDISRETRELVKKTAAEMGYLPDLLARSLSSRRSYLLGVVVPKITYAFMATVVEAIQETAMHRGYGIVLAVSQERADWERQHIERLLAMRVDGLLVSVSQQAFQGEVYERVQQMGVPLVFFDRAIEGRGFSRVVVDDREGAYQAIAYMIRKGYRKIAHVAGPSTVLIGRERRAGYEAALREAGIPVRPEWIVEGGFDEWHGYYAFKRLLQRKELPEVIFAVTFPVALGIRAAMWERDPALLDRIQLISFSEGGLNEFYVYPHICIRQPAREIGRRAVELLIEAIESEDKLEPRQVVLKTELITPEDYLRRFAVRMATERPTAG
ncbi:MAG: LacI family DNA-binding transcriptional regulator [Rhodothermus sp.]|nr:LacI family DNA-binding transcriptional regulator [Rhodothermus sp.]